VNRETMIFNRAASQDFTASSASRVIRHRSPRRKNRSCYKRSAKETAIFVSLNKREKIVDSRHYAIGLVAMPFQISPLPENLPAPGSFIVCRLCDRALDSLGLISPMAADFEYLNALPVDTE
jgi:hypothetical protein